MYDNLIIGSGSIKGLMYIGALKYLLKEKIYLNINTYSGCSIGSIVCLLLIIGYSIEEIERVIYSTKQQDLIDISINNFFSDYGIDDGNTIISFIKKLIIAKDIDPEITMKELYFKTKKDFYILSVNLTKNEEVYFNHETHPDLPVYLAIRMSTSIPLVWKKVIYNGDIYIDGAFSSYIPLNFKKDVKLDNCLILSISNETKQQSCEINDIFEYMFFILQYTKRKHYKNEIEKVIESTLHIKLLDTLGINPIKFDMDIETKKNLIEEGYKQAKLIISK